MANDAPAESLSQKLERYFSLLILFIYRQNMISNDVNWWKTDFWPPNHCPIIFPTMSPLFSQMSPRFQEPWDIVPSYEISRQNTACEWKILKTSYLTGIWMEILCNDGAYKRLLDNSFVFCFFWWSKFTLVGWNLFGQYPYRHTRVGWVKCKMPFVVYSWAQLFKSSDVVS